VQLTPYLSFSGRCEEAFRFYEHVLGAKITFMLPHSDGQAGILHATLLVGEQTVNGADMPPAQYEAPKGFFLALATRDPAEADQLFNALAVNGTIQMPLQQTFWSPRFGMLIDQFGIPWMINCEP
jgi:PhnB protein